MNPRHTNRYRFLQALICTLDQLTRQLINISHKVCFIQITCIMWKQAVNHMKLLGNTWIYFIKRFKNSYHEHLYSTQSHQYSQYHHPLISWRIKTSWGSFRFFSDIKQQHMIIWKNEFKHTPKQNYNAKFCKREMHIQPWITSYHTPKQHYPQKEVLCPPKSNKMRFNRYGVNPKFQKCNIFQYRKSIYTKF